MGKFKVGDRIIQDGTGLLATVLYRDTNETLREVYIVQSDDSPEEVRLWNLAIWSVLEEEKLPEMPDSVLYRSTVHELEVVSTAKESWGSEIFIGMRKQGRPDDVFTGLHLTAEEALQLSQDLLRLALSAKRQREGV